MLQFWKKTKDKQKNCPPSSSTSLDVGVGHKISEQKQIKISPPLTAADLNNLCDIDEFESKRKRSKLGRNLSEILSDKDGLQYFTQYMSSKNASNYIMCYLDILSYKTFFYQQTSKMDHDSMSVSTDCDSITTDTNSLSEYSNENKVTQSFPDIHSLCDISDSSSKREMKTAQPVEHSLYIFKKYIALEATDNIQCTELIRKEIIENICDNNKVLSGNCFDKLQNFLYDVIEKEYFDTFLISDYFCKYQIDILTTGQVALDDILLNETVLFYFMEFLQQENVCQLLEFWIAATNLQQNLQSQQDFFDPIEAQSDAVILYDKYFSLQAHSPLGFDDSIRFSLEQNICGEHGLVLDCFSQPLKLVEQVLETKYLEPFLSSQLFYKYLSEMINTVQSNDYLVTLENRSSDCSSERSFSTNNTFLALELNSNSRRRKDRYSDMNIETRQLCDPDALWRRKRSHRLSCGRITALGKFETDLDPEPDRRDFKLKNVVRKLVSFEEEDKKKEEMAWQVAEMIVKDITNVTLNSERANSSL